MSRGHGAVQRKVLVWLAQTGDMSLDFLAGCIYQAEELSNSQRNTVRRAVAGLVREGRVVPGAVDAYGKDTVRLSNKVPKRTWRVAKGPRLVTWE